MKFYFGKYQTPYSYRIKNWIDNTFGDSVFWWVVKTPWLYSTIEFLDKFQPNQKIRVRNDDWDCWSADHTLSHIIVPILEQIRDDKHGVPYVENEDLPEELQYHKDPTGVGYPDIATMEKAWNWVVEEMLFAMRYIRDDPEELDTVENENRVQRGCHLFGKYFRNLWT